MSDREPAQPLKRAPASATRRGLPDAMVIAALLAVLIGWAASEFWVAEIRQQAAVALREQLAAVSEVFGAGTAEVPGPDGAPSAIRLGPEALEPYARFAGLHLLRSAGADDPPDLGGADGALRAVERTSALRGAPDVTLVAGVDASVITPLTDRARILMAGSVTFVVLLLLAGTLLRRWRDRGSERRQRAFRHSETVLAGVCAIVVSLTANIYLVSTDHHDRERVLADLRRQAVHNVRQNAAGVDLFLAAVARFYEGSAEVTAAEFDVFARPFQGKIPADEVAWMPRVRAEEWGAFQAVLDAVAEETGPVRVPDAPEGFRAPDGRVEHFPALYVIRAADAPEELVPGAVAPADAAWRPVLETARARAVRFASGPYSPPGGSAESWVRLFLSVNRPPTERAWPWSGSGLLSVRVPLVRLLADAGVASVSGEPMLHVEMEDIEELTCPSPTDPQEARRAIGAAPTFAARRPVRAFGRVWGLRLRPTETFLRAYPARIHGVRYLMGLFVGAAVTAVIGLARERGARLERAVRARTYDLERREEDLAASERRYRQLFAQMTNGFALHEMVFNPQGRPVDYRFLEVNPAFERLTGLRAADLLGRTVLDTLPGLEQTWIERYGRVVETGEPVRFEEFSGALGRLFDVYAYRPAPGQFAVIIGDITARRELEEERRRMERKLLQSQRLESLGLLAGGIAHDFNNFLMTILGNAELAGNSLSKPQTVADHLGEIQTATRRAADLCRQMLAYAGRGRLAVGPVDLNPLIEETLHLLKASISRRAQVKLQLAPGLSPVLGDASQIRQVVMNLAINAAEALGGQDGMVSISTSLVHCDRAALAEALFAENLPEGSYVALEVLDTGCGMDAETQGRIFDPFFTTKFTGRGLGLSAVMGILRTHQGALKLTSAPGRGSLFKVLLPAAPPVADSPAPEAPAAETEWRGRGTVLLADDEDGVRSVGSTMLKRLGFRVLTAVDGAAAVSLYGQHVTEIACAILDLGMPKMGGDEAFRRIRDIAPGAKVILASGFNAETAAAAEGLTGVAGFIQKPYSLRDLQRVLRDVLG